MSLVIKENAFKKNDVRGKVGSEITPELCELIGKAYAQFITKRLSEEERKEIWVSVTQDARFHSPDLTEHFIYGLKSFGINVLNLGLAPTPMGYFSEYADLSSEGIKNLAGAAIVTASHNPPEYNGIKMTFRKESFSEANMEELKNLVKDLNANPTDEKLLHGSERNFNLVPQYISTVSNLFPKMGQDIKVVVDSGNATGGIVGPELYRELGCEVIDIFSEPDGTFPNHHPDPSNEKNLRHLKEKVLETGADFGIAYDGDSDRIGVIDNTGYSIPGDQLLLVYALDILKDFKQRNEKPVFISEVKCSQLLFDMINQNGGQAIMWKTGHGYIKGKMKEEKAILAGEMSGHIFFKDRYYGFDDAVYAGCRIIEIVAKNKLENPNFKLSDLIGNLPKVCTSREERIPCPDELKQKILEELKIRIKEIPDLFGSKIEDIITLDGLRIIFPDGFALVRASNTEPVFTARFEAKTQEKMEQYKNTMIKTIDELLENLRAKA